MGRWPGSNSTVGQLYAGQQPNGRVRPQEQERAPPQLADAQAPGARRHEGGPGRVAGQPLLLCRQGHSARSHGHRRLPVLHQHVSYPRFPPSPLPLPFPPPPLPLALFCFLQLSPSFPQLPLPYNSLTHCAQLLTLLMLLLSY